MLTEINANQEHFIKYKLTLRNEGEMVSQTKENWGNSSSVYLPYMKCWKEFFKFKWKKANWWHENI